MQDTALAIALVGVLIFAAHLFEAFFRHTRVPDVLPLVIIGLILGPLLGIAKPDHFGGIGPAFTTITFIFILFQAGIGIKISTLRNTYKQITLLSVISFVVTVMAVGIGAYFLTDLGWVRSLILASVLGGYSAAIIVPMINHLKMHEESKAVLLLESSLSDVFLVIGTLSMIEVAKMGSVATFNIGQTLGKIIASFTLATMFGMLTAIAWSFILNKVRSLQNSIFTTAAFVFVVFGVLEWLGYSGAVAALVFGIMLGNITSLNVAGLQHRINVKPSELTATERAFFSELVFILKTFFFVYMGISLQMADWHVMLVGLALTAIIFIVRIPVIKLTLKKHTPIMDASIMSVVIPRGLASAVVAAIPFQQGISGGETIQSIAYAIILCSIIFTSVLVFLIEKTSFSKLYSWLFANMGKPPPVM